MPEIVNWGSFDSFFNGALLRRPRRLFSVTSLGAPSTCWADLPDRERDPLLVTASRYFARDVGPAVKNVPRHAPAMR